MIIQIQPYVQLLLNVCNLLGLAYVFYKFTRKPQDSLEERVTVLEVKCKEHDDALHQGNDKFRELKQASTLIVTSVLALIEFEVDYCMHHGDEKISESLNDAKNDLYKFLAEK